MVVTIKLEKVCSISKTKKNGQGVVMTTKLDLVDMCSVYAVSEN